MHAFRFSHLFHLLTFTTRNLRANHMHNAHHQRVAHAKRPAAILLNIAQTPSELTVKEAGQIQLLINFAALCEHVCMSQGKHDIPSRIEYDQLHIPLPVNLFLPDTDLTVNRALSLIPEADRENYAALYRWFQQRTDTIGSRHYGKKLPNVNFAHAAQRGIHAPSGRKYAATVTVKRNSLYESGSDGQRIELGDGTWVVYYSAHRNNTGGETERVWNEKLLNCLSDGVPVGLFLQVGRSSEEYLRALVFVEEYDPDSQLFTLHGPVTAATEHLFKASASTSGIVTAPEQKILLPSAEDLLQEQRERVIKEQVVRKGQRGFRQKLLDAYDGKCAITGSETDRVLQAAHIVDYRGTQANAVQNGLLLRSDVHLLFDANLLGINPSSMRVEIKQNVPDAEYTNLDGRQILLPKNAELRPYEPYLVAKYNRFLCA